MESALVLWKGVGMDKGRRMLLIGVKWCVIIGITLLWGKRVVGVIGEISELISGLLEPCQFFSHSMGIPSF